MFIHGKKAKCLQLIISEKAIKNGTDRIKAMPNWMHSAELFHSQGFVGRLNTLQDISKLLLSRCGNVNNLIKKEKQNFSFVLSLAMNCSVNKRSIFFSHLH